MVQPFAKSANKLICAAMIDEWITVSNDEVSLPFSFGSTSAASPSHQVRWGSPTQKSRLQGQRVLAIICGANLDFEQLANIARRSAVGATRRCFLQIEIPESPGAMLELTQHLPASTNIVAFQYGKMQRQTAFPILGFEVSPQSHSSSQLSQTQGCALQMSVKMPASALT